MSTIKAQVDLILGDGEDDVFEAGRWARNELAGPEGDLILRVIELHERGVERMLPSSRILVVCFRAP